MGYINIALHLGNLLDRKNTLNVDFYYGSQWWTLSYECAKEIYDILLKGEYIEVDISKQKLKYFNKNGKVIVKTDVVTGLDKQRDTVLGAYKIYSKEYDRLLRGANYTSHVDYWMPFYGGYGLHDADWRSSFGGNIYKYSGSHGCVNIPDAKAKKIYQKSKVGTKVLIHR